MKKREIKDLELNALRRTFDGVRDLLFLEPNRIDSELDYEFRKTLREKQLKAQLVKNTLFRKVLKDQGMQVDGDGIWDGPTLAIWGPDNIKDLAKELEKILDGIPPDPKTGPKFQIKSAVADGQAVTLEEAKKLPTRYEAIADLLGALVGPAMNLSGALQGPAANLAGALQGPGGELGALLEAIEAKRNEAGEAGEAG